MKQLAKSIKKLQQIKAKKAAFDFDVNVDYGKSAAIGAMIADYAYDKYKSEKAHHLDEITFARFSENDLNEGIIFGEAMKFTRDPCKYTRTNCNSYKTFRNCKRTGRNRDKSIR